MKWTFLCASQVLLDLKLDGNKFLEGVSNDHIVAISKDIGRALALNESLVKLSLQDNSLMTISAQSIVAGMEHNRTLQDLDLKHNNISMSIYAAQQVTYPLCSKKTRVLRVVLSWNCLVQSHKMMG